MPPPNARRRILIVQGHPDADPRRLCRALADAYAEGAAAAGHAVARIDLAAMEVPLLRSRQEFEDGVPPENLRLAQREILAADHLVIVFPLWLGTMPALLKAFLEQTLRPGFAFAQLQVGGARRLLRGKSARIVVTMGMPALVYRWWFMADGVRGLKRGILGFAGFAPIRTTLLGSVETATAATRRGWCERMRGLGRAAA